jgi:predicted Fe-Mo cluster-binding NifX family protein
LWRIKIRDLKFGISKEGSLMKYAISTEGNYVAAHFGRCPEFTIVDIENGEMKSREKVANPGHHPGFLPQFLSERGVSCIVAGGMGRRAQDLFLEKGIEMVVGVEGDVEDTIGRLKAGTLASGPSLCKPGSGRGYGIEKTECTHGEDHPG